MTKREFLEQLSLVDDDTEMRFLLTDQEGNGEKTIVAYDVALVAHRDKPGAALCVIAFS